MENLKTNVVLFLELKLMEKLGLDAEEFEFECGDFLNSAYKIQEEQISDAWCTGYQQSLADNQVREQKSNYLDFDHYIKKTYGKII